MCASLGKCAVIVVAGGKGTRMGGELPKQFLPLLGRPVLMHTIDALRSALPEAGIVLALAPEEHSRWQGLCRRHAFVSPTVVNGGRERFHSVQCALASVPSDVELIGVHDGVRPLVAAEVVAAAFAEAAISGAAIPVVDVVETLRRLSPDACGPDRKDQGRSPSGEVVPRSQYRLVQTPQVFRAEWLRVAYAQPYREGFTDDASVVEAAGYPVTLVSGNRENIKITLPADLLIAEALLTARHTPKNP